uniref:Uncharacterized protein n=1 Tax=Anguilla anguilla TaxID=7936 RepID=A0A0E9SKL3_ANGAN
MHHVANHESQWQLHYIITILPAMNL